MEDAPAARALPGQASAGEVRLHAVPQRRRHGGEQRGVARTATSATSTATCTRCTCARSSRSSAARRCRPTASSATPTSQHLEGRRDRRRGEKLFIELGCHGCHLAEGYEDLPKEHGIVGDRAVAPPHRRQGRAGLARALDHESARVSGRARACRTSCSRGSRRRRITGLSARTCDAQEPSDEWLAAHPDPSTVPADADARREGPGAHGQLGCRGCHALAPDEVAGPARRQQGHRAEPLATSPRRPTRAGSTTGSRTRAASPTSRACRACACPTTRRAAITAYLADARGKPQPADDALKARLADPANVAGGEKLVRKYGCPGCHDIPGMESESRIGAELSTFGGKPQRGALLRRPHRPRRELGRPGRSTSSRSRAATRPSGSSSSCRSSTSPTRTSRRSACSCASRTEREGAARSYKPHTAGREQIVARAAGSSAATTAPAATSSRARGGNIRRLYEDQLVHGAAEPQRRGQEGAVAVALQLPRRPRRSGRGSRSACPRSGLTDEDATTLRRATSRAIDRKYRSCTS